MGINAVQITGKDKDNPNNKVTYNKLNPSKQPSLRYEGPLLIYCTPEKITKNKTLLNTLEKAYQQKWIKRIVIDEAHCCSEWGHEFRPDYKNLSVLRLQLPKVPIR